MRPIVGISDDTTMLETKINTKGFIGDRFFGTKGTHGIFPGSIDDVTGLDPTIAYQSMNGAISKREFTVAHARNGRSFTEHRKILAGLRCNLRKPVQKGKNGSHNNKRI